jgi:hypothetical protein
MTIIGGGKIGNARGETHLDSSDTTDLVVAGQYYVLNGDFSGEDLNLFTSEIDGTLTFIGAGTAIFLFNFHFAVKVSKATVITFGLFLNDVLIPKAEIDEEFLSQAKVGGAALSSLASVSSGDELQIRAKSSQASTTLTLDRLGLVLWGN